MVQPVEMSVLVQAFEAAAHTGHQDASKALKAAGKPVEAIDIKGNFCTLWAKYGPLVSQVASFIAWVPGFGSGVAAAIKGAVAVVDQVATSVCGTAAASTPAPAGGSGSPNHPDRTA
jgi:hypothetical protein